MGEILSVWHGKRFFSRTGRDAKAIVGRSHRLWIFWLTCVSVLRSVGGDDNSPNGKPKLKNPPPTKIGWHTAHHLFGKFVSVRSGILPPNILHVFQPSISSISKVSRLLIGEKLRHPSIEECFFWEGFAVQILRRRRFQSLLFKLVVVCRIGRVVRPAGATDFEVLA